jgi:uncharacterized glyoxalase superfamily protein PhnB
MTQPPSRAFEHVIIPFLIVDDAAAAIEFYGRAFGARQKSCLTGPEGKVLHAELWIGDAPLYLADAFPDRGMRSPKSLGGTAVAVHLNVSDARALFDQATAAGATVQLPLHDAFWGDRFGQLVDPFGHVWSVSQHLEDVPPEEIQRRAQTACRALEKN